MLSNGNLKGLLEDRTCKSKNIEKKKIRKKRTSLMLGCKYNALHKAIPIKVEIKITNLPLP